MIDVFNEKLLTLHQVCELLPGNDDGPMVYETILGWTRKGRSPRLESVKVGGKRYTSERALREFVVASNEDDEAASQIIERVVSKKRSSARAKESMNRLESQFSI